MTTATVAMSGALVMVGVLLLVVGLVPRTVEERGDWSGGSESGRSRRRRWSGQGLRTGWRGQPRSFWLKVAGSVVAGLVAFAVSGWVLMLVVVPVAVWGVPWLLGGPTNHEIELVRALDRWTRALASAMPTGKSVADAVRATRRQAPPAISAQVSRVVQRLDARWSAPDALRAMADELDSADADACLAALALASRRGGVGTTATLHSLSDSLQQRLRALREIEAERAKPRLVVQQITTITLVVMGAALLFGGRFFDPYSTPLGQAILAVLLGIYVASLVILRRKTLPRHRERILSSPTAG